MYTIKLSSTLNRITDTLIQDNVQSEEQTATNRDKIVKPHLSPMVNLGQPENLHGLAERIVAVESLIFLSKQFEALQSYLEHLVSPPNKKMLQQFFNQVLFSE